MTAVLQRKYTATEYLQREAAKSADEPKSEYFDGKLIDMPTASENHDSIVTNLIYNFHPLRKKGYKEFTGDVKVKISPTRYVYPDITLVKKPPQFAEDEFYNLLNPLLIIEVLSKSTESKDRSFKFRAYRELPSLKEYILVSQYEYCVESFHKNEKGEWIVGQTCTSLEDIYQFKSIDFQLSVAAIYDEVIIEIPKEEE